MSDIPVYSDSYLLAPRFNACPYVLEPFHKSHTALYHVCVLLEECHVFTESAEVQLEGVACTDEVRPSVLVTVTDVQGVDVTSGDVAWNMADEDDLPEACTHIGANQWHCAEEVPGDIRIDITNAGPYEDFTQVVTVEEDPCHVITEELDAVLEYLPD